MLAGPPRAARPPSAERRQLDRPWLAHYEPGIPAEVAVPEHPVTQNLIAATETHPDRAALIYGNVVEPLRNALMDARMSYASVLESVYRCAAALHELGVRKGDRVAIHLPNCPQFPIAYYAALMIGAIAVPRNPTYEARELLHQLRDSGAETIVTLSLN